MHTPSDILSTVSRLRVVRLSDSMRAVQQRHGISPLRQSLEMARLRFGPGQLLPYEYYRYHVYHPSLSRAEKRAFVGDAAAQAMNASLTAPELADARFAIDDKAVFLALCDAGGIPSTPMQAMFAKRRALGGWLALHTADALTDFLLHKARYPLFGKPSVGRQGIGGVQIEGLDESGHLMFVHGQRGPHAASFAAEVALKFSGGYLFQDCARMSRAMRTLSPDALGPLRITTYMDGDDQPQLLFAFLRLPASGTEAGPGRGKTRLTAEIDIETGQLLRTADPQQGSSVMIETHPVTGQHLPGFPVEGFADAAALAKQCHLIQPEIGTIGWDIALTDQGPLMIEGNKNPSLGIYQFTTHRGLLSPQIAPIIARLRARAQAQSAALRKSSRDWELGALREVVALERGRIKT